ncbi:hypothetical protein BDA99DRAFT_540295 [Phascolomyces articulosus]|uniref:Uncharacterized protein n=1 Tax=Phascolomyces articulosus TaxID=60185 RepID=A0AAD5K4E1_9FUNG|nr:hypothetical protein BDA99DRAFT_540295 [Phascolomyces articulosus]
MLMIDHEPSDIFRRFIISKQRYQGNAYMHFNLDIENKELARLFAPQNKMWHLQKYGEQSLTRSRRYVSVYEKRIFTWLYDGFWCTDQALVLNHKSRPNSRSNGKRPLPSVDIPNHMYKKYITCDKMNEKKQQQQQQQMGAFCIKDYWRLQPVKNTLVWYLSNQQWLIRIQ